jgi:hypothetical protein
MRATEGEAGTGFRQKWRLEKRRLLPPAEISFSPVFDGGDVCPDRRHRLKSASPGYGGASRWHESSD